MKKVLIINDSRFECMILAELLSHLSYESEMSDEFNALVDVESYSPDIVIVNYIMEEVRGDKLIQIIKAGRPEIICLISSSNALKIEDFKLCGVDGIVRTPVSAFTLKDSLNRAIIKKADSAMEDQRRCNHCNADISEFSSQIRFCPFCGQEMIEPGK